MSTVLVNARISQDYRDRAQEVLKQNGMTLSGYLRAVIEHLVNTGQPIELEEEMKQKEREERLKAFYEITEVLERGNFFEGVGDADYRELIGEDRMRKYEQADSVRH